MSAERTYLVYALVDPRDGLPHYVGCTSDDQPRRNNHRLPTSATTSAKREWICGLIESGLEFEWQVLESSQDWRHIRDAEQRWIAHGRSVGWPLTNGKGRKGYGSGRPKGLRCAVQGCEHPAHLYDVCREHNPGLAKLARIHRDADGNPEAISAAILALPKQIFRMKSTTEEED